MHPLNEALPGPYVHVRVTRGARWYIILRGILMSRFVLLSVSLRNDLADPVFDGVGLAGFKIRANAFLLA